MTLLSKTVLEVQKHGNDRWRNSERSEDGRWISVVVTVHKVLNNFVV